MLKKFNSDDRPTTRHPWRHGARVLVICRAGRGHDRRAQTARWPRDPHRDSPAGARSRGSCVVGRPVGGADSMSRSGWASGRHSRASLELAQERQSTHIRGIHALLLGRFSDSRNVLLRLIAPCTPEPGVPRARICSRSTISRCTIRHATHRRPPRFSTLWFYMFQAVFDTVHRAVTRVDDAVVPAGDDVVRAPAMVNWLTCGSMVPTQSAKLI